MLIPISFHFQNPPTAMDPEEANLIRTLQELQHSIEKGDKECIKNTIASFHQNLADNKRRISDLYKRGVECTSQTDLILAACRNNQANILYYVLRETDILVHLADDRLDVAEVNTQRTEALKHALRLEDFDLVEMLYDFWCGNLYWRGHDIENIKMVGYVLRNAQDPCPDYDDQLKANVHCLTTFNDFLMKLYTELAGFDNSHKPKQSATMILKVLSIYDKYSDLKKIRRQHCLQEREQIITEKIADNSSSYYINLEYIYHEFYFRKIDFNVALLILENVYDIREHLKTSLNKTEKFYKANPSKRDLYEEVANKYKEIESEIYHFIYRTSENWRLYLPRNRELTIEEYIVIYEGREEKKENTT